jgi:putative FmdB family regulatory protein
MPTYQYKCPKCGYEFEESQRMTDPSIEICPECKGKTNRIISGGAGFLFKGSGFYTTEHRSQSYRDAAKKENGGVAPTKTKETKKDASTGTSPKND